MITTNLLIFALTSVTKGIGTYIGYQGGGGGGGSVSHDSLDLEAWNSCEE